jgi:hypothetical protein
MPNLTHMGKFIDMTGRKCGHLTVLRQSGLLAGKPAWECLCKCGTTIVTRGSDLRMGKSTSCGCHRIAKITKHGHTTHGASPTPTYLSWQAMIGRCSSPSQYGYKLYGVRGIGVCERWHDFRNFLTDMGERPPKHTIDRINPDGHYEPSNCRWATKNVQSATQRRPGSLPTRPRDAKGRYFSHVSSVR